jgi:hypothetical protein
VVESNINCGCEIWTLDYTVKKHLLSPERDFWKGAATTSKILKIRNEELEKNERNTNNLGKNGSSLLNGTEMYYVWEVTDGKR